MSKVINDKIMEAFISINKQKEAHFIESIISLFNKGILRHNVSLPRTKFNPENYNMTVECASGITFNGRDKIIALEQRLKEAEGLFWLCACYDENEGTCSVCKYNKRYREKEK